MKNPTLILVSFFFIIQTTFAQKVDELFFQEVDVFMSEIVVNGAVKYKQLKNDVALAKLIEKVQNADLSGTSETTQKAFKINAYNLQVINAVAQLYPLTTVQSEAGFFDRKKIIVAGEKYTLNGFEKKELLEEYKDPRLHFVLVCGAVSCPPIIAAAYQPEQLEDQLEKQTKSALNNPSFIQTENNTVAFSKIFDWYSEDFGGTKKAIFSFINQYRTEAISSSTKLKYYPYDWTLNDYVQKKIALAPRDNSSTSNIENRYVVSSTIPKGSIETKIFNNLYTQRTGSKESLVNRATFFTTLTSVLYGLTNRVNVGFVSRYRRVRNDPLPSDAIHVFKKNDDNSQSRQGFTGIGPQVRIAPVAAWENFSIQSAFTFPIGKDLDGGSGTQAYIDWDGPIWNTQIFNDLSIGSRFSLFTEVDILLEDIGSSSKGHQNRFSTPATVILSYSPDPKVILYALAGYSPYWQSEFDYFYQGGFGAKYQFTSKLELELLYTGFRNKEMIETGGKAATYNLGLRFNL